MAEISSVLAEIDKLNLDEKEYILEILSKRFIQEKRKSIVEREKQAQDAYNQGKIHGGTVSELMDYLND